jgi:hypothetical protein
MYWRITRLFDDPLVVLCHLIVWLNPHVTQNSGIESAKLWLFRAFDEAGLIV